MKRISQYWIVAIIVIIPMIAFATVHLLQDKYDALPKLNSATGLLNNEYKFLNQYSGEKTFSDWKGQILVIDFFFTSCPTICPKMTKNLESLAIRFANEKRIHLLSFTVDPKHDSSLRLLNYAKNIGAIYPGWEFLTGNKKVIYKLARKEFFVTATDGDGGLQDFIHTDKIILIDGERNIRGYYDGTSKTEVLQLITDVQKLQHESKI